MARISHFCDSAVRFRLSDYGEKIGQRDAKAALRPTNG